MGRTISKARQARLLYQVKVGRTVTISEVAQTIGVTRAFLSNVERGVAWPSQRVVEGLCQLYGVTPGDLIDYEERRTLGLVPA